MSEWISVKDRLPDNCEEVIFLAGDRVIVGYSVMSSNGGYWRDASRACIPSTAVTYWQPLPDPPPSEAR
jgi:Protein of unknown function (DUF551)